jgi:uncharacterized protein (DUF58 family)
VRLRVSRIPRSTPLGRRAGLVGLGLLAAGFNTGNNLFYLFFSVLAATELIGFLAAGRALRRAQVEVALPRRGRQGSPLRATLRVTNRSRWLPLPSFHFRLRATDGTEAEATTPALAPGASGVGVARLLVARRGWLELERIDLVTDFPFGLSGRNARVEHPPARALVFPRPLRAAARASARFRGAATETTKSRDVGEEPVDARDYRTGDDARRIDWKASARTDRLIWRSRKGSPPASIAVRLDRSGPPGPAFEDRVARAAGSVSGALARGLAVGFESDECAFPPLTGAAHRRRIFEYLALVAAAGERRAS